MCMVQLSKCSQTKGHPLHQFIPWQSTNHHTHHEAIMTFTGECLLEHHTTRVTLDWASRGADWRQLAEYLLGLGLVFSIIPARLQRENATIQLIQAVKDSTHYTRIILARFSLYVYRIMTWQLFMSLSCIQYSVLMGPMQTVLYYLL